MKLGKNIFWRLIYAAFSLNLLMLILSLCASWMNPKYFWPPAFIKLFFFLWLIINVLFLALFIIRKKRIFLIIASVGILLCFPAFGKIFAFHPFYKATVPEKKLRVMTYNVMGFAWYAKKKDAFMILKNIREQQPDIVCMQEYLARTDDKFHILDSLTNKYGYKYYKEHVIVNSGKFYYFGGAVFSKYPLQNYHRIPFHNSVTNGAFYIDVPMGKDTFRLVNVHFQSFSLKPREYDWEAKYQGKTSRYKLIKIALYKMRLAFRKKSFQTEEVKKVLKASPYPIILCGDFNDTPLSYTYSELTEDLDDSYLATGSGLGTTYAGNLPYLRIDYILADKKFRPFNSFVVRKGASDHYPYVCDFKVK